MAASEQNYTVCHKKGLGDTFVPAMNVRASSKYRAALLYATQKKLEIVNQWGNGIWAAREPGVRFASPIYIHVNRQDARSGH